MSATDEEVGKMEMNLVVVGQGGCGKSTVAGDLIYTRGRCREQEGGLEKIEIVDLLKSERQRQTTTPTEVWQFESEHYRFTIIDAPGHRDFIKNMITGNRKADIAILVVAASHGEFETGMSRDGQTCEHALLTFTLGVKQIIVCVNKMDDPSVQFSQTRFDEVRKDVGAYLKKVGYDPKRIPFIPISGRHGDNVTEPSGQMRWYSGRTLIEALDTITPPPRLTEKPLRLTLEEVYRLGGVGTVPVGRVETGTLRPGMTVSFAPGGVTAEVRSVEIKNGMLQLALPGESVGFSVGEDVLATDLQRGMVVSDATNDPARECESFLAHVIILAQPIGSASIQVGHTSVIDCHTAHVPCEFVEILSRMDSSNGKEIERNPAVMKAGDAAIVRIRPMEPLCVETFSGYAPLGRFAIRDQKKTLAVGVIKEVMKCKVSNLNARPNGIVLPALAVPFGGNPTCAQPGARGDHEGGGLGASE